MQRQGTRLNLNLSKTMNSSFRIKVCSQLTESWIFSGNPKLSLGEAGKQDDLK